MVAGVVVMLGLVVMIAVPDSVQLGLGLRALPFDVPDQLVTDWTGVTTQAVVVDPEGMEDQWLLFVNHLGKVAQLAPVEGFGVDMDVDAALAVDFSTGLADGPNHLLQLLEVVIGQHQAHQLCPQVRWHIGQGGVVDHLPLAAPQVFHLPRIVAGRCADMPDMAADHRVDCPGYLFLGAFYGF